MTIVGEPSDRDRLRLVSVRGRFEREEQESWNSNITSSVMQERI